MPIKRKSERGYIPDISEEEDEDTEEIIKELQKTDLRCSLEILMMRLKWNNQK
jgi:hypothetical protein